MTKMAKYGQPKMHLGTKNSLKLKFCPENDNNGENCMWLKQMQAANEEHHSNKWWP